MNEIHQHPDGLIYVRAPGAVYMDSAANFEADFGAGLPAFPPGADEHIYTQGRRHCFMGGGNVIDGGPLPWPDGDAILARLAAAIAAQQRRRAMPAA